MVHPFDDLDVATGQGTIAMEIIKELPTVDYILVPIGGGGLATGVSTLAKLLNPKIKVIGVEPAGANCMQESIKAAYSYVKSQSKKLGINPEKEPQKVNEIYAKHNLPIKYGSDNRLTGNYKRFAVI